MDIKSKIIIVTGASMGIGEAVARALANEGATVVLAARSKEVLEKLSSELPNSLVVPTDMTKLADIAHLVQTTLDTYGRIDAIINNAGQGIYGAIENVDIEAYKTIFELNVLGPLRAMQAVIPIMKRQGGGTILNVSSMVSKMSIPYLGAYASTKYALNALSLTARAELAKDNIIVSIMLPGLTDTDFGKNAIKSDEVARGLESRHRDNMPQADSPEYIAGRILDTLRSGDAEVLVHEQRA